MTSEQRAAAVTAGAQALHRALAPLLPWTETEQWERVATAVIDAAGPYLCEPRPDPRDWQ